MLGIDNSVKCDVIKYNEILHRWFFFYLFSWTHLDFWNMSTEDEITAGGNKLSQREGLHALIVAMVIDSSDLCYLLIMQNHK